MCFSKPSTSQPKMTQPTIGTTADDEASKDAAEKRRKKSLQANGRKSTLLTGEAGDTSTANTAKKTLLGQ